MRCEICDREITRLYDPHLSFPDIMVDLDDDGEKEPLCRHCAVGILLLNDKLIPSSLPSTKSEEDDS